ncbi:MAG TPA: YqgE/AlgH family protein [Steroidobacteraceae bacterium]|jgi:putative transcriptional regulator|nr:YqgE/AlgH family protein [Steroidobacteraceae bacterium]
MRARFRRRRELARALCVLAALCALPRTTPADDTKPLTAILIKATAGLSDPFFADSVVLVMNNLGPAPVGIVINRPTPLPVARLFPDLKRLAEVPDHVYFGGPVEFESVWFLVRAAKTPEHAVQACAGVYLSASRELLLRLLGRDKPMEGLRIFMGHAGWGPGQLEAEIARGDWRLARAEPAAIFGNKSEHPWPAPQAPSDGT